MEEIKRLDFLESIFHSKAKQRFKKDCINDKSYVKRVKKTFVIL